MVDFLFVKIQLFRYLLRLSRYKRKSVEVGVFRRVGVLSAHISDVRGVVHQPLLMTENQSDCLSVWYQDVRSALFGFVTQKYACHRQTDGQTDRQSDIVTIANNALA